MTSGQPGLNKDREKMRKAYDLACGPLFKAPTRRAQYQNNARVPS